MMMKEWWPSMTWFARAARDNFGVAVLREDGTYVTKCVSCADEALNWNASSAALTERALIALCGGRLDQAAVARRTSGFAVKGFPPGPCNRPTAYKERP